MKNNGAKQTLQFGARRIPYRLHRDDRKHLRIVVSPDSSVHVYAPKRIAVRNVRAGVRKKAPWIAGKLDKVREYHPLPSPKKYVSGETLVYLGRQYRLKIVKGPRQPSKLIGRFLYVWTETRDDTGGAKRAVQAWYRSRAEQRFNTYLDQGYGVAKRHGVRRPELAIRVMRKRWGSCSPAGRITLNVSLVQVPVHCIEYVIMHELCHMKHHNHSKAFYSLLTRCMPDWRRRKEALDRITLQQ